MHEQSDQTPIVLLFINSFFMNRRTIGVRRFDPMTVLPSHPSHAIFILYVIQTPQQNLFSRVLFALTLFKYDNQKKKTKTFLTIPKVYIVRKGSFDLFIFSTIPKNMEKFECCVRQNGLKKNEFVLKEKWICACHRFSTRKKACNLKSIRESFLYQSSSFRTRYASRGIDGQIDTLRHYTHSCNKIRCRCCIHSEIRFVRRLVVVYLHHKRTHTPLVSMECVFLCIEAIYLKRNACGCMESRER